VRITITSVCVSAMLWPTAKIVSHSSESAREPGLPSVPNVSLSAKSDVAVQSRVFPSRWGVPIPARTTTASV
jgi:hypothetical protein